MQNQGTGQILASSYFLFIMYCEHKSLAYWKTTYRYLERTEISYLRPLSCCTNISGHRSKNRPLSKIQTCHQPSDSDTQWGVACIWQTRLWSIEDDAEMCSGERNGCRRYGSPYRICNTKLKKTFNYSNLIKWSCKSVQASTKFLCSRLQCWNLLEKHSLLRFPQP